MTYIILISEYCAYPILSSTVFNRSIKRKKFDDEVVESSLPTKLIPVERTRRVKRAPNPKQVTIPHTKWGPKDDLKLILAVQQCSDLALVHKCVKFAQKLTYQEVGKLDSRYGELVSISFWLFSSRVTAHFLSINTTGCRIIYLALVRLI